jgi:hypothetical protein
MSQLIMCKLAIAQEPKIDYILEEDVVFLYVCT